MTRVLVTGATGFVGTAVCERLRTSGYTVRRTFRSSGLKERGSSDVRASVEDVLVGEIGPLTDWGSALRDVDVVVHLAARVHVLRDSAADPAAEYDRANVEGTRHLAEQAAIAGIQRMVLMSTVKVLGEESAHPFRESDEPNPGDPYAESKWRAEQALREVAAKSRLEAVVLRPPLVYGPRVKANFLRLFRSVDRGIPLPFGGIRNRRSLVYVGNLADAVARAVDAPSAAGETFLIADDDAVSTPQLVYEIANSLDRKPRLLPVPPGWLMAVSRLVGRGSAAQRLCGSLEVDTSRIRDDLGWSPPFTLQQGLAETAGWYAAQRDPSE